MTPEIVSLESARGKVRVTYALIDGPEAFGPFVDHIEDGDDVQDHVSAAAERFGESLRVAEMTENLSKVSQPTVPPPVTFARSTRMDLLPLAREKYAVETGLEAILIGAFIRDAYTDAEISEAFGVAIPSVAWDALNAKLTGQLQMRALGQSQTGA